ncbi:hypothetical protein AB1Y20_012929 [Prymnesium parvum]|uniref:Peptidylprolyl isomerase n=2 Tax=Prymnesium parvum TaxID=97485 RepID=A0AB34IMU3_PRYPA
MGETFAYVLIPADDDEPMRELSMKEPEDLETNIGCLTKELQEYYRKFAGAQTEEGKKALVDATRQQLKKQQPDANPDEEMMSRLAMSQTVDIIQLRPATADSGWMGVNMYIDDKSVSKESPINRRATAICVECGLHSEVRGDAFIARLWDDQDGFKRHSITINELSSDAPWVVSARTFHANRPSMDESSARLKAMTAGGKQEPSPPLEERLPKAMAARTSGTELFKAGDIEGAAKQYLSAIALMEDRSQESTEENLKSAKELLIGSLVNLAACRLRQERHYDVIDACDRALELDDGAAKAWYKRGQACMALEQYGAARKNLVRAATLLPSSREIRDAIDACKRKASEKGIEFKL